MDGELRLWEARSGALVRTLTGHRGTVWTCAWSPAGAILASAGDDGELKLWDGKTGALVQALTSHRGIVFTCAWSPDGAILASAGDDGEVRLWEASSGALLWTLTGHRGRVSTCAWSRHGAQLASAGDDGEVRLWNPHTGALLGWVASGPRGSVAVAPDGSHRTQGDVSGWFAVSHGLHRYEVGEVDRWAPEMRVPDGEDFPWGRTHRPTS